MNNNNNEILDQFNKIMKNHGYTPKNLCRPSKFTKTKIKIGKGEYGTVFQGKLSNKSNKYNIVYKVLDYDKMMRANGILYNTGDLAQVEFDVSRKLIDGGIKNVPKVYKIHACHKGNGNNAVTAPRYEVNSKKKRVSTILYSEFINGEDLNNKLAKLNRKQCISLLVQTIYSLYKIHDRFPSFRHHDLHLGNIMIKEVPKKSIHCKSLSTYTPPNKSLFNKGTNDNVDFKFDNAGIEVVLIDFGLSHIPEVNISNPSVLLPNQNNRNEGLMKDHGIFNGSDQCYDVHYFLNALYIASSRLKSNTGPRMIAKFVKNELGLNSKFFGGNSDAIRNSRLRYDYKGIGMPNYNSLLNIIYEKLIKQNQNVAGILKRGTTTPKRAPGELVRAANGSKRINTQKTREQRDKEAIQTLQLGKLGQGISRQRRPGIRRPVAMRTATARNQTPQTRSKNLQEMRRLLDTSLKGQGVNKTLNRVKTANSYKFGTYIRNNNKKSVNDRPIAGSVKTGKPKSIVHTSKPNTRPNNRSN